MKAERYLPAGLLKPFIKMFLIIESENGMENKLLPGTSIAMAFRFRGKVIRNAEGIKSHMPRSVITGLRKRPHIVSYAKKTANLIVIFTETGAAAFFKEPLHELFGMSLPLDHLINPYRLSEVEEKLAETENNPQRIAIIEQFLLSELREQPQDLLVIEAVQKIKSAGGNIRIKGLAARQA